MCAPGSVVQCSHGGTEGTGEVYLISHVSSFIFHNLRKEIGAWPKGVAYNCIKCPGGTM